MTSEQSSEQWNVKGKAERNVYIGNQGPIIPGNQGVVNITYEPAPLPEAIGIPNNLRRSGVVAFAGRDGALGELHQRVQANERLAIVSIRGMGGVGKTELALQYGLRYGRVYEGGLCWLRAGEDLGAQIIAFARAQLDLSPPINLEVLGQVAYCWRHWRAGEVLIIFDDVKQYPAIEPFLPPSERRFKVLLTTRVQLGGAFSELALDILGRVESLALLRALVSNGRIDADPEHAEWLCDWLGDLPLGLELVGRYLAQKPRVSLTKLRERLESKRLDANALERVYPGMTAIAGVAAAFEVSWEVLDSVAQTLAGLLSLFALAPIPWRLVQDCLPDWDEEDLEDCRDGLLASHLLQPMDSEEDESYQLHQLLREFFVVKLRGMANVGELSEQYCQVMVQVAQQIPDSPTRDQITAFSSAMGHVAEVATTLQGWLSDEDLVCPFVGLGRFYKGQGTYEQAAPWFEQCLSVARDRLGAEHPDVAHSLNNLALLYDSQGRYGEAEPLFVEALAMRKRLLGAEHPDVATSLNNLALFCDSQGRYGEAEPLYVEALAMRKRLLGAEHPDVATSLNNLALLYDSQGRYGEAEPLYVEALAMSKRLLGAEHPDVATSLNNLAGLYFSQGRYGEAEPLYVEALAMYKRLLGAEHPDVASILLNLGAMRYRQQQYAEAEALLLEALPIYQQALEENHPRTQNLRSWLDAVQSALGSDA